jgi:hypothetical protein
VPGGPRGLQNRWEAVKPSPVCSIRTLSASLRLRVREYSEGCHAEVRLDRVRGVQEPISKLRLGRPANRERRRAPQTSVLIACESAKAGVQRQTTMQKFYYVSILKSEVNPGRFYVRRTESLKERQMRHNHGEISSTATNKSWRI